MAIVKTDILHTAPVVSAALSFRNNTRLQPVECLQIFNFA
jgi:hypothetical protein